MKKYLIHLLCISFISCNENIEEIPPANILTKKQMVEVMIDIQLIEGGIALKQFKPNDAREEISNYYNSVFRTHHTTHQVFEASFKYYNDRLEILEEIYEEVINGLSKRQAEVENQKKATPEN